MSMKKLDHSNPRKKLLTVFDDMVTDVETNKKISL